MRVRILRFVVVVVVGMRVFELYRQWNVDLGLDCVQTVRVTRGSSRFVQNRASLVSKRGATKSEAREET